MLGLPAFHARGTTRNDLSQLRRAFVLEAGELLALGRHPHTAVRKPLHGAAMTTCIMDPWSRLVCQGPGGTPGVCHHLWGHSRLFNSTQLVVPPTDKLGHPCMGHICFWPHTLCRPDSHRPPTCVWTAGAAMTRMLVAPPLHLPRVRDQTHAGNVPGGRWPCRKHPAASVYTTHPEPHPESSPQSAPKLSPERSAKSIGRTDAAEGISHPPQAAMCSPPVLSTALPAGPPLTWLPHTLRTCVTDS